ncbi:Spindle assembly checkpoint component MAD1 [Meyerozyma sp. JA9]|nr:Spindle assembly checkpoint component MAD1 [Meyerozyma sp. JA9]
MSSSGSSPFVEHPRLSLDTTSDHGLRQKVSQLEFQLTSLRTEKKLYQQEKESLVSKYEELITQKNSELNTLQSDFDFLYKQREQLQSKYDNAQSIHQTHFDELKTQLKDAKIERNDLVERNSALESKYNNIRRLYEQLRADSKYHEEVAEQLQDKIDDLEEGNKSLRKTNDHLMDKLNLIGGQMSSGTASEILQQKLYQLQRTTADQQQKINELLKQKESADLLREKNISLTKKVAMLEPYEEKYCQLEVHHLELKAKFDAYFDLIESHTRQGNSKSTEDRIYSFMDNYKNLQNTNLVLRSKFDECQIQLTDTQTQLAEHMAANGELQQKIRTLQEVVDSRQQLIEKLERQKLLNVKEINFLRDSLKQQDTLIAQKKTTDPPADANGSHAQNLQKLLDECRAEINNLQARANQPTPNFETGNKRPAYESPIRTSITSLEGENVRLRARVKTLEQEVEAVQARLKEYSQLQDKRKSLHTLQLRLNPASQDQIVKQAMLDALRHENEDLLKKYVENEEVKSIPRAVFERQEFDKQQLKDEVESLSKRNSRLKSIYSEKSRDVLSVISKYFGYNIEFIANPINPNDILSRMKLVSRYKPSDEPKNDYLLLDTGTKSLKAYGSYEFKSKCETLVAQWVTEQDEIPCFLSALTLSMQNRNVSA